MQGDHQPAFREPPGFFFSPHATFALESNSRLHRA